MGVICYCIGMKRRLSVAIAAVISCRVYAVMSG